jgi:hypothetical protein
MHLQKHIPFLCLFLTSLRLPAQSLPQVEIQLLANEQVAEVNLDPVTFPTWGKQMTDRVDSAFLSEKAKRDVMILLTLHAQAEPEVHVFARPAFTEAEMKQIQDAFTHIPSFHTLLIDYSFVYLVKLNGGSGDKAAAFNPVYEDPKEASRKAFKRKGLAEKKSELMNWAVTEVMPVLAAKELKVNEKFSGVRYMGKTLNKICFLYESHKLVPSALSLTDSVADYWRGVMEMSPGNEIIPLSKVMLLVAEGRFDYAKEYTELLRHFCSDKALATYYINELSWKLEEFNRELNVRTRHGVEQHQKGNFQGAMAVYEGVLADYPNSAWLHYEMYFSKTQARNAVKKDSLLSQSEWNEARKQIYTLNPLYPLSGKASSGKENYQSARRFELNKLFKDKEKLSPDMESLADIALDLESYGYAAEAYWLCFSRLKKADIGNREMLPYCLYSLDKLGVSEISKNFQGDFEKEFKRIEKEQKKKMESSPYYKAMRNKN